MACLLILFATYYQYQNESIDYNIFRLNRKESQLRKQINYLVEKNNLLNKKYDLWNSYNDEFNAVIKIHNVNYSVFDVNGKALFTSFLPLKIIANSYSLDEELLSEIISNSDRRVLEKNDDEIGKFQSSYSVLKDKFGNPYGILFFPTVYHVHLPRESDHLRCMTNSFKNSKFFQMQPSMTLPVQAVRRVNERQAKPKKRG